MTHKEFFEHNWRLGEIVYVVEQLGRYVEEVDASYPTGRILKTRVCLINKYDYPKNYYYTHQRNRIIMNIAAVSSGTLKRDFPDSPIPAPSPVKVTPVA